MPKKKNYSNRQNRNNLILKRFDNLGKLVKEQGTETRDEMAALKDEMITMKDEIVGELKNVREEQTILSSQHRRILELEDKTEKLAKIHPKWQHSPA